MKHQATLIVSVSGTKLDQRLSKHSCVHFKGIKEQELKALWHTMNR